MVEYTSVHDIKPVGASLLAIAIYLTALQYQTGAFQLSKRCAINSDSRHRPINRRCLGQPRNVPGTILCPSPTALSYAPIDTIRLTG